MIINCKETKRRKLLQKRREDYKKYCDLHIEQEKKHYESKKSEASVKAQSDAGKDGKSSKNHSSEQESDAS